MKKTTLVIMAAGIGSRYGAGIKQLAAVDKSGHIIMDYSIHDAIAAGFQKIVFIIRRDIEKDFREVIGNRIEAVCAKAGVEVAYCFQSLTEIPGSLPEGRSKPWGTGQAVLAAKDHIDGPFAVINADDYYGKSIYREIHDYLLSHMDQRITIEGLCHLYPINPTTLKEVFKDVYGTSIAAHLKEHRLEKAARLLRETDASMAEVARRVGYESQSKFTAAFKDQYGCLPTMYRKMS